MADGVDELESEELQHPRGEGPMRRKTHHRGHRKKGGRRRTRNRRCKGHEYAVGDVKRAPVVNRAEVIEAASARFSVESREEGPRGEEDKQS